MRYVLLVMALGTAVGRADEFRLRDGDRVVLLGGTLVEREQRHGFWEVMLTALQPAARVTFRNLGWSGDTVWGESRCSFDFAKPNEGLRRITTHTLALKPTVLIVAYGGNEAFAGPAGLGRFRQGLTALLDALAPSKARVLLLAPLAAEARGAPLPSPGILNGHLALYRETIREVARERGHGWADIDAVAHRMPLSPGESLTDNGLHLTPFGYWMTAAWLANDLRLNEPALEVRLRGAGKQRAALPALPLPASADAPARLRAVYAVRAEGLAAGTYALRVDGKEQVRGDAAAFARGVLVRGGPDFDQAETLRARIVEKNQTYFHRWRPQNETYLFGFRKHEQGQNAREIPEFDPLVEKLEEEIARLRKPAEREYELIRLP